MTETVLKEIVHRAVRDGSFRAQLRSDPAGALAAFSITAEERSALASGDPARLTALGVDQRMSRMFAAGVFGEASKVIVVDEVTPGGGAFIDEGASSGSAPETAIDDGGWSAWSRTHLRMIEQDLDTGGAVTADAPADVYLTQDEELFATRQLTAEGAQGSNLLRLDHELYPDASLDASTEPQGTPDLNQDGSWDSDGDALTEY